MKTIILISMVILASTAAVAQETYKCKTPGGMVYQDRPCAGVRYAGDAQPAKPAGSGAAPPAAAAAPSSDLERNKAYIASREKERRIGEMKEQIARAEESIAASQQARDAELAQIDERKSLANNNLAGANLEQALATEKQSVNARFATDISLKQDRLRQLREEMAQIR
jgi:hypothetical protein